MASSPWPGPLDTIGPMVNCVEDAAIMLQHLAGYDPRDSGLRRRSRRLTIFRRWTGWTAHLGLA